MWISCLAGQVGNLGRRAAGQCQSRCTAWTYEGGDVTSTVPDPHDAVHVPPENEIQFRFPHGPSPTGIRGLSFADMRKSSASLGTGSVSLLAEESGGKDCRRRCWSMVAKGPSEVLAYICCDIVGEVSFYCDPTWVWRTSSRHWSSAARRHSAC